MGISKTSVLVLALASLALAYPASDDKEIDHDVEIIPLEKRRPDLPAYFDEDAFDPEEVGFFPFSFTQSLADFMNRWIKDVSEMFGSIPTKNVSSFGHFPGIPNLGDIDLSKGNTTSVVKIIDGHRVEINETVFRKDLANGGSYYKVKLVNVLPDEQPEGGSEGPEVAASSTPRDVETVENSRENEIPPLEGPRYDHIETFDREWNELDSVESFGGNELDYGQLADDIRVNRVLAARGQPINPDAEYFDVRDVEKLS